MGCDTEGVIHATRDHYRFNRRRIVRRVGLVPAHRLPMRNILEQGVYLHVLR